MLNYVFMLIAIVKMNILHTARHEVPSISIKIYILLERNCSIYIFIYIYIYICLYVQNSLLKLDGFES